MGAKDSTPEGLPKPLRGHVPKKFGQAIIYDLMEYSAFFEPERESASVNGKPRPPRPKRLRRPRSGKYPVIFINGQLGTPLKHMYQALATCAVTGGKVIGVYNAGNTNGKANSLVADLAHSMSLKATSSTKMKVGVAIDKVIGKVIGAEGRAEAELLAFLERDDPASATLFQLLVSAGSFANARICAHSQGNLIACNALNAVVALRGEEAISNIRVHAFGSPVTSWSAADPIVTKHEFSNDAITWLAFNSSDGVGVSKYGSRLSGVNANEREGSQVPTKLTKSRWNVLTHSYYLYLSQLWSKLQRHFP